jgi:hypothetical protein
LKLCEKILGSGRNITCDNWFVSVKLVQELMQRNLTLVGTIRSNKRDIPKEFLCNKNLKRETNSSVFGFNDNMTLFSYVPKQNKTCDNDCVDDYVK